MDTTTKIYLLRHGEIDLQEKKSFVGWTDVPLNEKGEAQARWWRKRFAHSHFDMIFCSTLLRSKATAKILAHNRKTAITELSRLREINLGEWEGLSHEEVRKRFPKEWEKRGSAMATYRPPGGESFSDLVNRVMPVFEKLVKNRGGDQLIVGHAGVNRVILCSLLGMYLDNLFRLKQDYGALNIINIEKERIKINLINMKPSIF